MATWIEVRAPLAGLRKKGESAEFRYRVIIHKGDNKAARIADQWTLYGQPPKVTGK